jgi:O-acetyl-ADP-ribose deacetylase (regulator of RNase III)
MIVKLFHANYSQIVKHRRLAARRSQALSNPTLLKADCMFALFGKSRLELVQGDITAQEVDAIVNAANSQLAGGGGVDGALHRAAGALLMEQTDARYPEGCPTGSAVATDAGRLKARYVFHAVGPVWRGGGAGEAALLASAVRRCLELAVEHACTSIAFPAISTGVYGYPKDLAAEVSLGTTREFLVKHTDPLLVRFVLFDAGTFGAFARVLESQRG